MNEKLYWTDYCEDHIEVYDPVTLDRRVLITTGTNPFAIIVDPGTGYVSYVHMHKLLINLPWCFFQMALLD